MNSKNFNHIIFNENEKYTGERIASSTNGAGKTKTDM